MTPRFARPVALYRAGGAEAHRKVSWLELFFDLIFVAAVAQVAEPLAHHYTLHGIVRFATLFALIWWAWAGYTFFATRFDADDPAQRALTLLQMFVVAAMAANAGDELDSRSTAGFAAAYAVLRLLLVAQYLRARHVREARAFTMRSIGGHGLAAVLWLISAMVPAPQRYVIWCAAFVIDLGTPWVALSHSLTAPTHSAHLPERFGLFTLILLGEAVVAVMHGMQSQEEWSAVAGLSAFLGMGLVFLIWWWYFDGARAASERAGHTHRDSLRTHIWSYAHFPLYLGIVLLGVGLERAVTAASRTRLGELDVAIMSAAAALVVGAMAVIAGTSGRRHHLPVLVARAAVASLVAVAVAAAARPTSPLVAVVALAAVCATQVRAPR